MFCEFPEIQSQRFIYADECKIRVPVSERRRKMAIVRATELQTSSWVTVTPVLCFLEWNTERSGFLRAAEKTEA